MLSNSQHMRTNIYKEKIVSLLKKEHLLSIGDIHKHIPSADYSTVYRNIEQLVQAGSIKKVILDKDKVLYEINNTGSQHDHFICTDCGSVDELDRSMLNLKSKSFKNCTVTDILFRGICEKCH